MPADVLEVIDEPPGIREGFYRSFWVIHNAGPSWSPVGCIRLSVKTATQRSLARSDGNDLRDQRTLRGGEALVSHLPHEGLPIRVVNLIEGL